MKLKLWNTKDQKKGESDGGSSFKLAAQGQQGLKSHILVGSMWHVLWDVALGVRGSSKIFI